MVTQVFTDEELERLREFPEIGRAELVRFFTLTSADVAFVDPGRGRGSAGPAVALCTVPWLGFMPAALLVRPDGYIAWRQPAATWTTTRPSTRCRPALAAVLSTTCRLSTRQHDALDELCVKVFEEKISGKLAVDARPALTAAIDYLRPGDMLTVQEVDRLGRNLLEGLLVLNDLFPAASRSRSSTASPPASTSSAA